MTSNSTFDFYHGTSTLFLDSIMKHGLGGINPVAEWKILELSKEVFALSEKHLSDSNLFKLSSCSFKEMTKQSTGGSMNFQHGETYLSASKKTAAQYAISKRYGSELLTYTIDFLQELLTNKIPEATRVLYRKYPKVFGLIEAQPSPLLVRVSGVDAAMLLDEYGNSPDGNLSEIIDMENEDADFRDQMLRQVNFRLKTSVQAERLDIWLINVTKWNPLMPDYNLYKVEKNATKM